MQSNSRLQENAISIKKNWTVVRFKLDEVGTRDVVLGTNLVSFPFVSFWVSDSSDSDFDVSITVNPKVDQGSPLTLKPNMSVNFESPQVGAVLIFPEQSGKWIEITFSHNNKMDSGSVAVSTSGNTSLSDGSSFSSDVYTVTSTRSLLIAASGSRTVATIENRGAETIYLGTQTAIDDVNYKNKCLRLHSGDNLTWRNSAGLYSRTDTTSNTEIFILEETI